MSKSSSRVELERVLSSFNLENGARIHINGKEHPTAVVVVDFGQPDQAVRLNSEQNSDLVHVLRKFAREQYNKDVNIRVSSDNYAGLVYWASAS